MKRILITGGAGFIGSHLADKLITEGNEVVVLDNFFTGSKQNIIHLLENPYFELIRHDVTQEIFLEVDEIYNLACPASPIHYQYNPIKTMKTSVMGAFNVLGLAKRVKAKVLQASTSEVYGDPEIHPQIETYRGNVNTFGPRSCYDEGKRCAETIFHDYHQQNQVPIKVIRIFNTYGPRMQPNDGRVVSNFIMQALQNKDISIFGDGLQTRSFQYVNDLVSGMVGFMQTPDQITGPVNIGNPEEYTILQLAQEIIKLSGSGSNIIYKALPQDDPLKRKPDISEIQKHIDWQPTVQLQEGLTKTIAYFDQVLSSKNHEKFSTHLHRHYQLQTSKSYQSIA